MSAPDLSTTDEVHAATARAHSNIALVKYWGKRDIRLNLPATGSVSVTLDALFSETRVCFDPTLDGDRFRYGEAPWEPAPARISRFLDLVREQAGQNTRAAITSRNNFPTGVGLASSASGFAALALAASRAAGLALSPRELSVLARQGSGSAARSVFGGLVEMHRGQADDGSDAYAESLAAPEDWPLSVAIVITDRSEKAVGSTEGMNRTAETSPYFTGWVDSSESDLATMREAVRQRDFEQLALVTEHSCLKMHGLMMSAQPGLIYFNPVTLAAIQTVRSLRQEGVPVCFTIDAGPQLKAVCLPEALDRVSQALGDLPGVLEVRQSVLGPGAHLVKDTE